MDTLGGFLESDKCAKVVCLHLCGLILAILHRTLLPQARTNNAENCWKNLAWQKPQLICLQVVIKKTRQKTQYFLHVIITVFHNLGIMTGNVQQISSLLFSADENFCFYIQESKDSCQIGTT